MHGTKTSADVPAGTAKCVRISWPATVEAQLRKLDSRRQTFTLILHDRDGAEAQDLLRDGSCHNAGDEDYGSRSAKCDALVISTPWESVREANLGDTRWISSLGTRIQPTLTVKLSANSSVNYWDKRKEFSTFLRRHTLPYSVPISGIGEEEPQTHGVASPE